jgi:chitodextrinase
VIVQDSFSRTVAGGLGTAPTGGAYTVSGKGFSVDGSAAALSLTKGTRVAAPAVTAVDSDAMVRVVFPAIPSAGQLRGEVLSRATGVTATSTWYEADLFLASDGRLTVALALSAGGRRTQYARRKLGIYAAGDAYWMRFDTAGSPAALSARVWRAADTEPSAWTLQTTATGGPSAAGRPAIGAHFQGLAHAATIRFDDLTVASVPPQDTTAPSPPGALGFSNVGRTGATVGWAPATDDVGVDHYEVSVDGSDAGTPAANSLDLTGLECATAYDVVVRAVDAAGNVSGPSEATLTTADCPDTTPPSAPGAPAFTNVTATTATASWNPSTDNVAVTGYAVAVDGADAGGTATTSLALTDLACGADHVVEVRAHDAAGNDSDPATATLTTAACPDTTPPSAPGSLVADPGQSTIDLRWDASTDDVGVSGYQVTANGVLVDEPAGTTASVPARCGTPYHLEVVAVDAAGNVSAPAAADVGMPACGGEPGEVRLFAADVTPASLTNAIAQAAADREYQPDPDTGPAAGLGPNALQGVVHLAREPGAPAFDGANAITIDALVTMRSNVRMEVDSGIRFDLEAARLFDLTGLTNVTITHGDPSMGSGRTAGKFIVDMADAPTASKRTAVLLTNTTAFRVEWLHTIQSTVTGTAAVVMRGRPGPSNGIYQHHSNEGSPPGYGPNQIGSLRIRLHRRHLDGWRHRTAAGDGQQRHRRARCHGGVPVRPERQPRDRALAALCGLRPSDDPSHLRGVDDRRGSARRDLGTGSQPDHGHPLRRHRGRPSGALHVDDGDRRVRGVGHERRAELRVGRVPRCPAADDVRERDQQRLDRRHGRDDRRHRVRPVRRAVFARHRITGRRLRPMLHRRRTGRLARILSTPGGLFRHAFATRRVVILRIRPGRIAACPTCRPSGSS